MTVTPFKCIPRIILYSLLSSFVCVCVWVIINILKIGRFQKLHQFRKTSVRIHTRFNVRGMP